MGGISEPDPVCCAGDGFSIETGRGGGPFPPELFEAAGFEVCED